MSFLPPVVMEIRANAAQFLSEQGKVIASAKTTAKETEAAAQKEAAAARAAAAEATRAAEQKTLASVTSAKAATAATDTRIAAEARATEAQAKATQMQASLTETSTAAQNAAYETQAAAAQKAASAVEVAAAKEVQAQDKAAAAAAAAAASQGKAADAQIVAAEKSAAAQEVGATRTKAAMTSIVGVANKVSAVSILAMAGIAVGATEMAAKFEKSTMLLVTAGGELHSNLETVRSGILKISTETGTSAEQLAEGMYIMEKAGYRGAAGLAALKASAQGAKDENVGLSIMAQAVTDVLLDYGYKMDTVADATDSSVRVTNMLVAASGAAKTTMQDYANSMAAVVPIASVAKISFDQVGGAIATMTQHGQSAQQSSQNLANLIQSLVRPNNLASAAMSQMGIDTTDLAQHLGERGLSGSLKIVSDAILKHMGPDGMVLQDTMKKNANAVQAMKTIMSQMPPELAKVSQGLIDGDVSIKKYTQSVQKYGGHAGALGLQLAGLYKSNEGVNNSLKAGRPAVETWNAALRDVLGNVTATRAAQMLLMNDSHEFQANIKAIGEAGQKTGKDIATWADMQDTLSVQTNQFQQMLANLGIELGTKLIPAAKGALSGITDLIHGFEKGDPILHGIVDLIGVALTISVVNFGIKMGQTAVKTVTSLVEMGAAAIAQSQLFVKGMFANEIAVGQFSTKAEQAGAKAKGLSGAMGAVGGAALLATGALAIVGANTEKAETSIDKVTKALSDFTDAGNAAGKTEMDALFQNWNKQFGKTETSINDMSGAIDKLTHRDFTATVNDWADNALQPLVGWLGIGKGEAGQLDDKFKQIGESLGQMAGSNITRAQAAFQKLALSTDGSTKSIQDILDHMPAYKAALEDQAHAVGQELSQQELLEFAYGKIPQKILNATKSTEQYTDATGKVKPLTPELSKSLDAAGVSADGLATDLQKVLDGMLATGMAVVSTRDATSNYNKALRDASGAVQGLIKSNVDVSNALNDNASDFNLTTEAGAALNEKFEAVKNKGLELAKSMIGPGVDAQKNVQGALSNTYTDMIKAADGMGIHGKAAEDLTRKLLGIPPNVDIKTWMDDFARQKAADTKKAIEDIPKVTDIAVRITKTIDTQVKGGGSADDPSLTALDPRHGGFTGGAVASIMGMYDGGVVPGNPPSRPNVDNILSLVNGKPLKVRSGEFINNEPSTKANLPWLKASNAGLNIGDAMNTRYASGYAQGASQAAPAYAMAGGGAPNITNNVNVQTNATGDTIANAIAWKMRTS